MTDDENEDWTPRREAELRRDDVVLRGHYSSSGQYEGCDRQNKKEFKQKPPLNKAAVKMVPSQGRTRFVLNKKPSSKLRNLLLPNSY